MAAKGVQTDAGNGIRLRHTAQGQSQATKAGGWWVWKTSTRMEFCDRRGGGEQVQGIEVIRQRMVTDAGAVGWRR